MIEQDVIMVEVEVEPITGSTSKTLVLLPIGMPSSMWHIINSGDCPGKCVLEISWGINTHQTIIDLSSEVNFMDIIRLIMPPWVRQYAVLPDLCVVDAYTT
jgi:hypothetical protein